MAYIGTKPSNQTPTYKQVYEYTATAGQTTFTASYTAGFVSVFRNGVQLGSEDYTATNGTSVVLTNGSTAGDYIRIESQFTANVQNAIPNTAGAVATSNIADGAITTAKIANGAVVPADLAQPLTLETAKASTSGTSIDFTGIPSWVKRITVMFSGVSTNGTSPLIIQLGDSGGFETTGYLGNSVIPVSGTTTAGASVTTGLSIFSAPAAASIIHGCVDIFSLGTSNTWVSRAALGASNTVAGAVGGSSKSLSDTLTQIRITTVNGTDTFDAGTINILYE